jgi:hypothetical protein
MPFWKKSPRWGAMLLGAWLIAWGLLQFPVLTIAGSEKVLALLAIAAGVLLLVER